MESGPPGRGGRELHYSGGAQRTKFFCDILNNFNIIPNNFLVISSLKFGKNLTILLKFWSLATKFLNT